MAFCREASVIFFALAAFATLFGLHACWVFLFSLTASSAADLVANGCGLELHVTFRQAPHQL